MSRLILLAASLASLASAWPTTGVQTGRILIESQGCINTEARWDLDDCDTFTVEALGETDQAGDFALSIKNSRGENCYLEDTHQRFTCGGAGATAWSVQPDGDADALVVDGDAETSTFSDEEGFLPDGRLTVGLILNGGLFDFNLYFNEN